MRLATLLESLVKRKHKGDVFREVFDITYDSRKVTTGSLFVAVRGEKTDGHKYIDSAIKNGAMGIVSEDDLDYPNIPVIRVPDSRYALAKLAECFNGYPAQKLKIIGVTGTNGKTTTTYMIAEVLKSFGKKCGIIGTLNIVIGDKKIPTRMTTPESADIQAILGKMVDAGVEYVIMEVSSHALHFNRVQGIEFQGGIFTNLTQDHLDLHQDMDSYFEEKMKMFKQIKPGNQGGFALINSDDMKTPEIVKQLNVPYKSYGIYRHPDIRAKNILADVNGTSFVAESERWDIPVQMKMLGLFNIYNALAAVGTGLFLGIPPVSISRGMANIKGVRGRFEVVDEGQEYGVVVDYAHTPDGLKNVLESAKELTGKRLITVFGCGGDRDSKKRPLMGEFASEYSDLIIITSDNPRTEDPLAIIRDILPGIEKGRTHYMVEADRRKAIFNAVELAEEGDLIVIAGKGHETYQIFKNKTVDFDDVATAREAIIERFKNSQG